MRRRLASLPAYLILAGLGASEILLTTVSRSLSPETAGLLNWVAESNAVEAVMAAVSLSNTELTWLATSAGMLFYGYTVYKFLPRIFPEDVSVFTNRTGYRLLMAIIVVFVGEYLVRFLSGTPRKLVATSIVPFLALVLVGVSYVVFVCRRDHVLSLSDVDSLFYRLSFDNPNIVDASLNSDSTYETILHIFTLSLLIVMPAYIFGVGVFAANLLYPVPELLAIGLFIAGIIRRRVPSADLGHVVKLDAINFEERILDFSANIVRSRKTIPLIFLSLFGFVGSGIYFGKFGNRYIEYAYATLEASVWYPLYIWAAVGMTAVAYSAGLFALWFWIRTFRRVPAYLEAWHTTNDVPSPLTDRELAEPVTRPVGMLIPVTVAMTPTILIRQMIEFHVFFGVRVPMLVAYGIMWPLSLALLAWAVYRTRRIDPQPPLTDGRAIPIAAFAELSPVLLGGYISNLFRRLSDVTYESTVEGMEILIFILAGMIVLHLYPNLSVRAKDAGGWRKYQHHVVFFGLGAICTVGALGNIIPTLNSFLTVIGFLFMVAPISEMIRKKKHLD